MSRIVIAIFVAAALALAACSQSPPQQQAKAAQKDGEPAVPADYKAWPRFLADVQRPDAKQVRDIYVDPAAAKTAAGAAFPYGTTFVMENYAAKAKPDGTLETGPDGKLVKGALVRVFVMTKERGGGQDVPEAVRNGEWIYAAYLPDGKKTEDNFVTCRSCHLPLGASKDFVHRYDEYFQKRAAQ